MAAANGGSGARVRATIGADGELDTCSHQRHLCLDASDDADSFFRHAAMGGWRDIQLDCARIAA